MAKNDLLRQIPKIDKLAQNNKLSSYTEISQDQVCEVLRKRIQELRENILNETCKVLPSEDEIIASVITELETKEHSRLIPVINGTGVVLHTNLGRSPLSHLSIQQMVKVAKSYSNLEYDVDEGQRTRREIHIEDMLCRLTGAQAALIVNNNVAAVILALSSLAKDKDVVISRSELVEIGGSFRLPEIIEAAGCHLKEVGTTNVTRKEDFIRAIDENTAALLKCSQSNFAFLGYWEEASIDELAQVAHDHGLPCIYDMGSGLMYSLQRFGIQDITVKKALESGVDIATFSCDKLLGGPQAGVIVGSFDYIEAIRNNPLMRAVRVDKLTLAALQATLAQYSSFNCAYENIPALSMIGMDEDEIFNRAQDVYHKVEEILGENIQEIKACDCLEIEKVFDTPGGGTSPACELPGYALVIRSCDPEALSSYLRRRKIPIVPRRKKDLILISLRTVLAEQEVPLAQGIAEALETFCLGDKDA